MDRLPAGFVDEMIASHSYARAYAANQADPKGSQSSPMRIAALEIEYALAQEEMDVVADGNVGTRGSIYRG